MARILLEANLDYHAGFNEVGEWYKDTIGANKQEILIYMLIKLRVYKICIYILKCQCKLFLLENSL